MLNLLLKFFKSQKTYLIYFVLFNLFIFWPTSIFAQIRDWDNMDGSGKSCLVNGVPTLKCLEVVVSNLLYISNGLIILVLFVMFVVGSYKWMMSLGQPEKLKSAQQTFTWAIIGLIVYAAAYLILFTIDQMFLGGKGDVFRLRIGD